MAKLNAAKRNKIPSSEFALPSERKYPVEDRSHAIAAKSRASQQVNKGNLSESQKRQVDAKANRVIGFGR